MNGALLNANGDSATKDICSVCGAGAGGSILLGMNKLIGNGTILANGGDASDLLGGGGAGGRIKFYFFYWFNIDWNAIMAQTNTSLLDI